MARQFQLCCQKIIKIGKRCCKMIEKIQFSSNNGFCIMQIIENIDKITYDIFLCTKLHIKITFLQKKKQVFLDVYLTMSWFLTCLWRLSMHRNDFEHHFRKLYIIFTHMESYKKLPESCSKVNFSAKNKAPEQFVLKIFEACRIQAYSVMNGQYIAYFIWFIW